MMYRWCCYYPLSLDTNPW